jgi:hypothetical protein
MAFGQLMEGVARQQRPPIVYLLCDKNVATAGPCGPDQDAGGAYLVTVIVIFFDITGGLWGTWL